jgi:hypothetical protein
MSDMVLIIPVPYPVLKGFFDASDPDERLVEAQQIKVARPPTVLRHIHSRKGPNSLQD